MQYALHNFIQDIELKLYNKIKNLKNPDHEVCFIKSLLRKYLIATLT